MHVLLLREMLEVTPLGSWEDNFVALDLEGVTAAPNKWTDFFKLWNVRYIADNSDDGYKTHDERIEPGRTRNVKQVLEQSTSPAWPAKTRYLHDVSNGALKLRGYPIATADRIDTANMPYVCGMISNEADAALAKKYGYWEVRLRLNSLTKGQHFALWLVPPSGDAWYEIDLLEVVNSGSTNKETFNCNSHGDGLVFPGGMTSYKPVDPNGWHTIGFEWTADMMRWYLDGTVVRQHANYVTDRTGYFMATWEIDSIWPGAPDGSTVWPCEAEIDYVKYFASKPAEPETWRFGGAGGYSEIAATSANTSLTLNEELYYTSPGDLQVAIIVSRSAADVSTPAGWTLAVQDSRGTSTGAGTKVASVAVFYRIRGADEGTLTFSIPSSVSGDGFFGRILRFHAPGGRAPTLVGAQANTDIGLTGATVTVPAVTGALAGDLSILAAAGSGWYPRLSGISGGGPSAPSGTVDLRVGEATGAWTIGSQQSVYVVGDFSFSFAYGATAAATSTTATFMGDSGNAAAVVVFRAG